VLFEKGRELYGLYQARQAIRDAGKVIVVEGYMDVVSLAQFGVNYAVATLGTSTTPTHVQKLLRQTDRVVFCFDGDNAGRKAAWRALENALPLLQDGKALDFLFLPQDEDPDSYVRHFGKERFEQLLDEDAVPLTGFLLSELSSKVDMQSDAGRARLLHSAKPLLSQIEAPALSLMLRSRLAELVGVAQDELDRLFGIRKAKSSKKLIAPAKTPRQPPSITRQLLQWLLQYPQLATTLALPPSDQEEIVAISMVQQFCLDCDHVPNLGQIIESVRGSAAEHLVRQTAKLLLEETPVLTEEEAAEEVRSLAESLQAKLRTEQLEHLQRKAQQSGLSDVEKQQLLELLKR
jgi:DNA primase